MALFKGLKRHYIAAVLAASLPLLLALSLSGWVVGLRISGNVHEVVPGELYRSAQLSGPFLNEIVDRYGIRSIINLRGKNSGLKWYQDELAAATRKGITHIDIDMSASQEPSAATIDRLIAAYKTAPKPILVHCEAGSDRSGLASAIYELIIDHRPATEASKQLSFYYGHFPWLTSKTGAMDRAFERVAGNT
jgi:protein tyrosine/serine phosphatase